MDILSGSYSGDSEPMAGHFQILWGKEDGTFKKSEALRGTDGKVLEITVPEDAKKNGDDADLWRICTRVSAVDWDGDGKLDLVSGNFLGTFVWFKGAGEGKFSPDSQVIMSGGKPLMVAGGGMHSDPVVVDWDGDGDLDLLSGSGNGGAQWAENTAGKGKPVSLSGFQQLIKGMNQRDVIPSWKGEDIQPGGSSRIWVSDVNGDGKLDITIGDNAYVMSPVRGLTLAQAKEKFVAWKKKMDAVNADMKKEDADEDKFYKDYDKLMDQLGKIAHTSGDGHVWLYLQK